MSARLASALAIAAILAAGLWAALGLRTGSDLARFMPAPVDADQRLVVGELGRGPGSRLLLLAIGDAPPDALADLSRGLRAALASSPALARVLNGEIDPATELATVLPLRFSHSPAMDAAAFDADALEAALAERLADLGGAGGEDFDTLLGHDPQLLTLAMAEAWRPAREPRLREGVWFTDRDEALLLLETRAAGFDPAAQAAVLDQVRAAFAGLPGAAEASLAISGPGSFSARMGERVRAEASLLGTIAGVALVVLLLLAYRSPLYVLASALPLACAGAVGLLVLRLAFTEVHGITLAFAITLVGVAQDYPVHLLSHSHPGQAPRQAARALWPALRLGVASTVIAYLTLFSGRAEGLAQLAAFTIAGLASAALVTRYLLPALLPPARRDVARGPLFAAFAPRLLAVRARLGAWLAVAALVVLALVAGGARPWWNNDLASLTPLPPAWLAQDARLRAALATPDARHLLLLQAHDRDRLLLLSERLAPRLDALVAAGELAGHGLPSRYQPSAARERARLARLPDPAALRSALAEASARTGFDPAFFEPMLADVADAGTPQAAARRAEAFAASPAGARIQGSLRAHDGGVLALVELSGIAGLPALQQAIAGEPQARLVDLKATAESMVAGFRERVLAGLAVAVLALLLLVTWALGVARAGRVLVPVALALAATVALLRLAGVDLSLFHLIALMLSVGLGMDYALFFGQGGAGAGAPALRTLHAVLLSAVSTALVFGLLASSSIPVLQAIGLTVAVGVAAQFALALMMARPDGHDGAVEGSHAGA
jgi:predicted exporter